MWFRKDICGIIAELQIRKYGKWNISNMYDNWCECDFCFRSGDWLNYHQESDECLLPFEVEYLEENLTKLLEDGFTQPSEVLLTEPDFKFSLYPKRDLREDPRCVYVPKGQEIEDIYAEWKIYFWHRGLTQNHLILTLDREDITDLRDYLSSVIHGSVR